MKREVEVSGYKALFLGLNLEVSGEKTRIFRIENAEQLENVAQVFYKSLSGLTARGNFEDDIFYEVDISRVCKDYVLRGVNHHYFKSFFYMRGDDNLYLIRMEEVFLDTSHFYLQEIKKDGNKYFLEKFDKEKCTVNASFFGNSKLTMFASSENSLKLLNKILLNSLKNTLQKEEDYNCVTINGLYEDYEGKLFRKKGNYFFEITLKEARTLGLLERLVTEYNENVFYYTSKIKSACHTIDLEWLRFAYDDRDISFKIDDLEYMYHNGHVFLCEYPRELGDISKLEFLEDFNERNDTEYTQIEQHTRKGITLLNEENTFTIEEYFCLCEEEYEGQLMIEDICEGHV